MVDPLTIGATLGSTLLGGVFNYFGSRNANQQNRANVQAQNAFTEKMWHLSNAHNDPSAQRERYERAGINPYLALGNITPGTASSMSGGAPAPAVDQLQGFSQGFTNLGSTFLQAYQQNRLTDAQIAKTNAETEAVKAGIPYIADKAKGEISQLNAGVSNTEQDTLLKKVEIQARTFSLEQMKDWSPLQKEALKANISKLWNESSLTDVRTRLEKYNLEHVAPRQAEMYKAQVSQLFASVGYFAKLGRLSEAQAGLVIEQASTELARRQNIKLDSYQIVKMLKHIDPNNQAMRALQGAQSNQANEQAKYLDGKPAREWAQIAISAIAGSNLMAPDAPPLPTNSYGVSAVPTISQSSYGFKSYRRK